MHIVHNINVSPDVEAYPKLRLSFSQQPSDPAWDQFVAATPGGHHAQTTLWAQLKTTIGWSAARVTVTAEDRIVGGVQLLRRTLPLGAAIGYVPKGPLLAIDGPRLSRWLIDALHQIARTQHIQALFLQPPEGAQALSGLLGGWGFEPSVVETLPANAVIVSLSDGLDAILARMKPKTRKNILLGERRGIRVRCGTQSDLDEFHQLLCSTGKRQFFPVYPKEYFVALWRLFAPVHAARLLLAEHRGQAVSAILLLACGDTVTAKCAGWSGQYGSCHPNELIHWAAMKWAKAEGYRYYDFEGINPEMAAALSVCAKDRNFLPRNAASFKMGFGGDLRYLPETQVYIYQPLLRWIYKTGRCWLANSAVLAKAQSHLRGTAPAG